MNIDKKAKSLNMDRTFFVRCAVLMGWEVGLIPTEYPCPDCHTDWYDSTRYGFHCQAIVHPTTCLVHPDNEDYKFYHKFTMLIDERDCERILRQIL